MAPGRKAQMSSIEADKSADQQQQQEEVEKAPSVGGKERICPICLHDVTLGDPTVLENCSHIFCFECIVEWTRLKPECPICKRGLQSLKHHLCMNIGEELPSWESEGKIESIIHLRSEYELEQIKHRTSYPPDIERHQVMQVANHMRGELHSLRNTSVTTMASHSIYRDAIAQLEKELNEYRQLLVKINGGATRSELFAEPAFRRIIYAKNLLPRSICPSMINVAFNSEYINANRQLVRAQLIPFVLREVSALTRKACVDIDTYMDILLEYFSSKTSRTEIVIFLKNRGIQNPHHFLNNLSHFASSGQTLEVYDQNSEYTTRRSGYLGALFPEDDDVLVLNGGGDVEVVGERRQDRSSSTEQRRQDRFPNRLNQQQQQDGTSSSRAIPEPVTPPLPAASSSHSVAPAVDDADFRSQLFSLNQYLQQLRDRDFNLPSIRWAPHHPLQPTSSSSANFPVTPPYPSGSQASSSDMNIAVGEQQQPEQPGPSSDIGSEIPPTSRRPWAHSPPLPRRRKYPTSPTRFPTSSSAAMVTLEDDSDDDTEDAVEFLQEVKRRRSMRGMEDEMIEDDDEEENGNEVEVEEAGGGDEAGMARQNDA